MTNRHFGAGSPGNTTAAATGRFKRKPQPIEALLAFGMLVLLVLVVPTVAGCSGVSGPSAHELAAWWEAADARVVFRGEGGETATLYLAAMPAAATSAQDGPYQWAQKRQRLDVSYQYEGLLSSVPRDDTYIVGGGRVQRCLKRTEDTGELLSEPACAPVPLAGLLDHTELAHLFEGPRLFEDEVPGYVLDSLGPDAERSGRNILGEKALCWSFDEHGFLSREFLEICYSEAGVPLAYTYSGGVLGEGFSITLEAIAIDDQVSDEDFHRLEDVSAWATFASSDGEERKER